MKTSYCIALITDTHLRPLYDDRQQAFASDQLHNDRCRQAVEFIRERQPDLVIHLGDVVHPIPKMDSQADALELASQIFDELDCPLLVVPGNHDVGDKQGTANAPSFDDRGRQRFQEKWGPLQRSCSLGDYRFLTIDSMEWGADSDRANSQRAWLESELKSNAEQTFLFTHYPLYLCEPHEPEHYDNMNRQARDSLLALIAKYQVRAVFSGHAHRFFYNRFDETDLYVLPATSFVRPEYAQLRSIAPVDDEYGRDDREQLGVTFLHVGRHEHQIEVQRLWSRSAEVTPSKATENEPSDNNLGLGVWLHSKLGQRHDITYGDLDGLYRKVARNDTVLLHLLELGFQRIRIPASDLECEDVWRRVMWLLRHQIGTTIYSAGVPSIAQQRVLASRWQPELGLEWEMVFKPTELEQSVELKEWNGPPLTLSRIGGPWDATQSGYHSHFPRQGFDPADPQLVDAVLRFTPGTIRRVAFRIAQDRSISETIEQAITCLATPRLEEYDLKIACHVELPFAAESRRHTDDEAVAQRCHEATQAVEACPTARLWLDLLTDKDRGYWCRNGLVDLADRPRAAYLALKAMRFS